MEDRMTDAMLKNLHRHKQQNTELQMFYINMCRICRRWKVYTNWEILSNLIKNYFGFVQNFTNLVQKR